MMERVATFSLGEFLCSWEDGRQIVNNLRLCRDYEDTTQDQRINRELPAGTDSHNLAETGWGLIIAPAEIDRGVKERLSPLIELRRAQAQADQANNLFRTLTYKKLKGRDYLFAEHGDAPGTIDPSALPYYILLIGSPEQIPFDFQYALAINRAVGRLYFDNLNDYTHYAQAVVEAERPKTKPNFRPRKIGLFSVESDETTEVLHSYFIEPLVQELQKRTPDWLTDCRKDRKEDLRAMLQGGDATPEVLLVTCHGRKKRFGDSEQEEQQGALSCSDGTFSAKDLEDLKPEDRPLNGLVAGLFACYSVGTPAMDNFPKGGFGSPESKKPKMIAETEFLARLPSALLARGALAVLGHVDRGWTASFRWIAQQRETDATRSLEDSIVRLLKGHRLGHALRPLYRRYSNIAAHLLPLVEALLNGKTPNEIETSLYWTAYLDARNYIILGDPAVYAGGPRRYPPVEKDESPGPDYAQPVYLQGRLARRARAKAREIDLDLNAWVHEILEAALQESEGSGEPSPRAKPLGFALKPLPFHLDGAANDSTSLEIGAWLADTDLLSAVEDPKSAALRVRLIRPHDAPEGEKTLLASIAPVEKNWEVTNAKGIRLGKPCFSQAEAIEVLRSQVQRYFLTQLAKRSGGPSMDLTLRRQTQDSPEPQKIRWASGEPRFDENDVFKIKIRNRGDNPLWTYLLDLDVATSIHRIHPASGTGDPIAPGESSTLEQQRFRMPEEFPFDEPGYRPAGGKEKLILLGSTEPLDLDPLFDGDASMAAPSSCALGRILASIMGTRTLPLEQDLADPSWGSVARSFLLWSEQNPAE